MPDARSNRHDHAHRPHHAEMAVPTVSLLRLSVGARLAAAAAASAVLWALVAAVTGAA